MRNRVLACPRRPRPNLFATAPRSRFALFAFVFSASANSVRSRSASQLQRFTLRRSFALDRQYGAAASIDQGASSNSPSAAGNSPSSVRQLLRSRPPTRRLFQPVHRLPRLASAELTLLPQRGPDCCRIQASISRGESGFRYPAVAKSPAIALRSRPRLAALKECLPRRSPVAPGLCCSCCSASFARFVATCSASRRKRSPMRSAA